MTTTNLFVLLLLASIFFAACFGELVGLVDVGTEVGIDTETGTVVLAKSGNLDSEECKKIHLEVSKLAETYNGGTGTTSVSSSDFTFSFSEATKSASWCSVPTADGQTIVDESCIVLAFQANENDVTFNWGPDNREIEVAGGTAKMTVTISDWPAIPVVPPIGESEFVLTLHFSWAIPEGAGDALDCDMSTRFSVPSKDDILTIVEDDNGSVEQVTVDAIFKVVINVNQYVRYDCNGGQASQTNGEWGALDIEVPESGSKDLDMTFTWKANRTSSNNGCHFYYDPDFLVGDGQLTDGLKIRDFIIIVCVSLVVCCCCIVLLCCLLCPCCPLYCCGKKKEKGDYPMY